QREPQQCEPPGRAGRRFFLRCDVEEKTSRWKLNPARTWRDQAQQPPQDRKVEKTQQDQRLGKSDGKTADHAIASGADLIVTGARFAFSPIRPCNESTSSLAGRSVR